MGHLAERIDEENATSTDTETESLITEKWGCCSLRGVQWRIKLGVLPLMKSSVDELRRAAADGRRRYADLRRRFLVDPHMMEEGQKTAHLNMDNPLSQDPESIWGRFFRNAELERSIDKDLSRLYPEHGSYFQTPACQAMLRRILLVWSLTHSEYSYRQGMHELLAPLLYVLHVDVTHLSHVKHLFENLSDERFDGLPFQDNNMSPRRKFEKQMNISLAGKNVPSIVEEDRRLSDCGGVEILKCQANMTRISSIDELDPEVRAIFSGSDAYGAEGELGALLSGRFIEHDAYCMFDALLSGQGGLFAMADYFIHYPEVGCASGLSPVIEASAHLYNLLAVIDMSLYSHLVELHVEPQFFALRWLRVLFGREFVLHDLLLVWDAVFSAANSYSPLAENDNHVNIIAGCDRSAFISVMAVSMLLHLRSSLLATPDATSCLQKLLNFPRNTDVRKLIENAVSLQHLAMSSVSSNSLLTKKGCNLDYTRMGKLIRSTSVSPSCQIPVISHRQQRSSPCSPDRLRVPLPESYWEEKWRTSVLQKSMPEKSSSQEVVDGSGKNSVGQGSEIKSVDSLSQQHLVLDSNGQTEQQRSRKGNCEALLKHDLEPVSSTHGCKNGTFGKATGCKSLDDQVNYAESQIESDVNKLLVSTTNKILGSLKQGHAGRQHLQDKYIQSNETNILNHKKQTCEGMQSENQKADSLGESCRILIDQQESDQSVPSFQAFLGTITGERKISECDINDVNKLGIGDRELNQSKDGNTGLCQSNPCEKSRSELKEPSGKSMTGNNASQMGGILTFWRKQKSSAAAHPGRLRWMWNLGRNPGVKVNTQSSKDELSANNIISAGSKKLSQENNVNQEAKTNVDVPNDDFVKRNVDLDARTSEGNNLSTGVKAIDECSKDESATHNADLGGEKKLSQEKVTPGKEANREIFENRFSANIPVPGSRWSSEENNSPSDVAVSSTPCSQLVLDKDGDGATINVDVKGTKVHNSSVVSEASQNSAEFTTESIAENPSVNLRIIGQSMLEKIQVLELSFLEDSMLETDAAALSALTGLREISNKLLQMSCSEGVVDIQENSSQH